MAPACAELSYSTVRVVTVPGPGTGLTHVEKLF